MGDIKDGFESTFRPFVVDGVPASGPNKPSKSEAAALGGKVEFEIALAAAAVSGDGVEAIRAAVQPIADEAGEFADAADASRIGAEQAVTSITGFSAKLSGSAVTSRSAPWQRVPVGAQFASDSFGGLCFVARGADLGDVVSGFEIWLRTANPAKKIVFNLRSRPIAGATTTGPSDADTLVLSEARMLSDLLPPFEVDGTVSRIVVDYLTPFIPDPANFYMLSVSLFDQSDAPVLFGFLAAAGAVAGNPGFPLINGFYRADTPTWSAFSSGDAGAIRWTQASRLLASGTSAAIASARTDSRTIPMGAPEGLLTTSAGGLPWPFIWWHETPAAQAGLVTRLFVKATAASYVEVVFGDRDADGDFAIRHSVPLKTAMGDNSYPAGAIFDAFPIEAGWHMGVRTSLQTDSVAFSVIGNSFQYVPMDEVTIYFRGATPSIGADVAVAPLPVSALDMKRRRALIWREEITGEPPIGWDQDPNILYQATGMRLGSAGASYATQVSTHRTVQADHRVTRVVLNWRNNADKFVIGALKPANEALGDLGFDNSGVQIDGAANRLAILGALSGGSSTPTIVSDVALGFAMTAGHQYLVEWGLSYTVHSVQVTDVTTGKQSPVLTSGDPNFAGIYTPEGYQNGALGFLYPSGNPEIVSVEVLYDGISPQIYVVGDSQAKQVLNGPEQSWPGRLKAAGATVMLSAQPGGSTELGRRVALQEIAAARPRWVIIVLQANDGIQNKPVADFKWQIADIINAARRVGAGIVLQVMHPNPLYNVAPYNAAIMALADGQSDIRLWRWDKALTVNGDGVTQNTALISQDDHLHPIPAGSAALYARLLVDVPGILD